MCGIIGIIGKAEVGPLLLEGLKRLEYRGYDSAGIATLSASGSLTCRRAEGKISQLESRVQQEPVTGNIGIGHTRWATHGQPSVSNAHPHRTEKVAVVHNGIIENFQELRAELEQQGCVFASETDTEVIPHLITQYLQQGDSPQQAIQHTLARLEGAFSLAVLFAHHQDLLIAARKGSPLVVGYGDGEMYIGSDALSLAPLTSKLTYLEDGDWAEITAKNVRIYDKQQQLVEREVKLTSISGAVIGKGNYRHFMLKEIYEQPGVIGGTLNAYYNPVTSQVNMPQLTCDLSAIEKITIIACGTSYYAGLVAKYWIEQNARIPVEIDVASEFRYREAVMSDRGLTLCISQSGETADTLAALRYAKQQGQYVVSIVNVEESSMAMESDAVLRTLAGPEIGVASTKAFTTQLVVLACMTVILADAKNAMSHNDRAALLKALTEVPARAADILNHDKALKQLAHDLADAHDILYIGRGTSYALALEGALKIKELSYIHAEGVAAGELKHGPIALIDETVPVITLAPVDALFEKTASNVQEVAARGARVIFLSDAEGVKRLKSISKETIELPTVHPFVTPILYSIPIQLLAYHTAVIKGTDVDQPRNLAKSVTVE